MCYRIALIQQGNLLSVATPQEMTRSFYEDLWAVQTRKIYNTAILLEKLPSLISVNSFGQVLHLVTSQGSQSSESIQKFLKQNGEEECVVKPLEATIEDVFILLMNRTREKS